jgi:uncharacterized membrane protein YhaH (DUF805 family)
MKHYLAVFQNYANFSGRARRSEYWFFVLFNTLAYILLAFIGVAMRFPFLAVIYVLVALIPSIAVAVRRMHDVNKSGWYSLIPIYSLILAFTEGDKSENYYGPDPKGEAINFDFENSSPAQ